MVSRIVVGARMIQIERPQIESYSKVQRSDGVPKVLTLPIGGELRRCEDLRRPRVKREFEHQLRCIPDLKTAMLASPSHETFSPCSRRIGFYVAGGKTSVEKDSGPRVNVYPSTISFSAIRIVVNSRVPSEDRRFDERRCRRRET